MSLKFPNIITAPCEVPVSVECPLPPSVDPRCEDPVFRAQNPGLCEGFARLIIKPGNIVLCDLQSTTFKAFLISEGLAEQEISTGLLWSTSDRAVIQISGLYGTATAVAMGMATITVTWQGLSASAQVTVLPECCADRKVGIAIVIDNSESMNQNFVGQFGGTKLAYAKKLASDYVGKLDLTKDVVSINVFSLSGAVVQDFTGTLADLQSAIAGIGMTHEPTDLAEAIGDAAAELDANTELDLKVILLFSDGYQTVVGDPLAPAEEFKSRGGFILAIGIRAHGVGFDLLSQIANTGFFLNAHIASETLIPNWLGGLSGYFCAGNCTPPGDITILGHGKLNYTGFANWDVWGIHGASSQVDLIGGDDAHPEYDLFDLIPGNGLYVDLRGSPGLGGLRSKDPIILTPGNRYHITVRLAGNQRKSDQYDTVRLSMGSQWTQSIGPIAPYSPFTEYTYSFTADTEVGVRFIIEQLDTTDPFAWRDVGNLLDLIKIEEEWLTTDAHFDTIVDDNFDTENGGYIPPECPTNILVMPDRFSPTVGMYGFGYGNCYGYGCLLEPIPAQVPDPAPLPIINEGSAQEFTMQNQTPNCSPCVDLPGLMAILANYPTRNELENYATKAYVDQRILEGGGSGPSPGMQHFIEDVNGNWIPDIDEGHSVGSKVFRVRSLYTDHTVIMPTDDFTEGALWLEHPSTGGQFHRIFLVGVEGGVTFGQIDTVGVSLPLDATINAEGVNRWSEATESWVPDVNGQRSLGAPDRTILSVFSRRVAIVDGLLYLRNPIVTSKWHNFRLALVEGFLVPDVDQNYINLPAGSGVISDMVVHWLEDFYGNWVPDMEHMFTLGREDRVLLSLYTKGPIIWHGDLYLLLGSAYYKVLLTVTEGVVVPDIEQTPTTIT